MSWKESTNQVEALRSDKFSYDNTQCKKEKKRNCIGHCLTAVVPN